jgi:prepilin-type N-terminal cleavage/methylation domain-containing protein
MIKARQTGFTLVELAIVLVVIGLILGMAFKGKDLIDSAKVKNMAAQYNKVVAASNTFYEKYGFYPGDGCTATNPTNIATQCAGIRNGVIDNANEQAAFWNLLVGTTNILTAADRRSVFGQDWGISLNNVGAPGVVGNNYLFIGNLPAANSADTRFVCALDRMIDDGVNTTGLVRSGAAYGAATDCWALANQTSILIRILP